LADEEVALEALEVPEWALMLTLTLTPMDMLMDDEVAMAVIAIARALEKDLLPHQESVLKVKVKNQVSPGNALVALAVPACMAVEAHTKDEEEEVDVTALGDAEGILLAVHLT